MAYTGIYERTIFYNPVNKYSVISVKTSDRSIPEKARSAYRHRDNMIHFAAVGYELPRTDQVSMILDGEWKEGKNGFQLHVTKCEEVVPQTREGIKGYLSSRLIKGIGGKTAELIVDRFGADTLHVLENEPERLLEIRGVSKAKLEEIIASYNESRTLRDLMLLLAPFQITPTTATKIYDHFGAHSVDILRDNPFELCQISGFGFKRVDAIMRKNNWPLNSPMRIRGAVFAALEGAKGDGGHLYLDAEQLRKESMALLNSMIPVPQMRVKADDLEAVIDDMLLQGKIINSNGNYYLVKTFAQEDETARSIARLLCRPVERVDVQDLLTRVRRQLGVELSLRQTEAVHMVFRSDLSIITGSPGTGKTTVLKAVIEVFKLLKPSENILLAAPTGRASRRMAESTGVNNASTLHSLLGLFGEDGGFRKGEEDMLDAGLIIVDESSMMDMWLARQFFSRIGPNTKVLLVGDADQLQSVGAGDVFRELIDCGLIPVTVLNEIFRQKKDSLIAYNAQKINNNDTGFFYGNDFTVCKWKFAASGYAEGATLDFSTDVEVSDSDSANYKNITFKSDCARPWEEIPFTITDVNGNVKQAKIVLDYPSKGTVSIEGTGKVTVNGSEYANGDVVKAMTDAELKLQATEASTFAGWEVSGTNITLTEEQAKANPLTITAPEGNFTIKAKFQKTLTVTLNQAEGGMATITPTDKAVGHTETTVTGVDNNSGDMVATLTATANDGYAFSGWEVSYLKNGKKGTANAKGANKLYHYVIDGKLSDDSIKVGFNDNPTKMYATLHVSLIVTPQFTKQLDVTIAESEGGTVTSSNTLTSLASGAQVTLTAAPNEGYGVLGWNVTDKDGNTTSDYTLKMANDTATITLGNTSLKVSAQFSADAGKFVVDALVALLIFGG